MEGDVEPVASRNSPARSGHSTRTRAPSAASSQPSSASSAVFDPEEIGMNDRIFDAFIDLHQRVGRARHFEFRLSGKLADECARKGGFAGAEVAGQGNEIAGPDQAGDNIGERDRRPLIDKDRSARSRFWPLSCDAEAAIAYVLFSAVERAEPAFRHFAHSSTSHCGPERCKSLSFPRPAPN